MLNVLCPLCIYRNIYLWLRGDAARSFFAVSFAREIKNAASVEIIFQAATACLCDDGERKFITDIEQTPRRSWRRNNLKYNVVGGVNGTVCLFKNDRICAPG